MTPKLLIGLNHVLQLCVLLMAGLAAAGCHKTVTQAGFDNAAPEIKVLWDTSVAADKANDYNTAIRGYRQIIDQPAQLSAGQIELAKEASRKLLERLMQASAKGDLAARQALAALRDLGRGQRP